MNRTRTLAQLLIVILSFGSCAKHIKRAKYTIATVIHAHHSTTSTAYAEYYVDGRRYGHDFDTWPSLEKGDCFRVIYDSLHPKKSHIILAEPLFNPDAVLVKTVGVITDEYKGGDYFKYHVKGEDSVYTFIKAQYHYKNISDPQHRIQKGAHFEVQYNMMNYKIAILYYDKPIEIPHPKRTVAEYHHGLRNKGIIVEKRPDYKFRINEVLYNAIGPAYGFEMNGERFTVVYDSLNPNDAQALVEEPTFFPDDTTVTTTGTITKMHQWTCEFNYNENTPGSKKGHTKTQQFYWDAPKKYSIQKGAKYRVKYLANDPKIAVIYFDQPVTDQ